MIYLGSCPKCEAAITWADYGLTFCQKCGYPSERPEAPVTGKQEGIVIFIPSFDDWHEGHPDGTHEEWASWAREKLGIEPTDRAPSHGLYMWHDGTLYKSYSRDDFFSAVPGFIQPGAPEILCGCGETRFTLHYGMYELLARCASCGKEAVVYDG